MNRHSCVPVHDGKFSKRALSGRFLRCRASPSCEKTNHARPHRPHRFCRYCVSCCPASYGDRPGFIPGGVCCRGEFLESARTMLPAIGSRIDAPCCGSFYGIGRHHAPADPARSRRQRALCYGSLHRAEHETIRRFASTACDAFVADSQMSAVGALNVLFS